MSNVMTMSSHERFIHAVLKAAIYVRIDIYMLNTKTKGRHRDSFRKYLTQAMAGHG